MQVTGLNTNNSLLPQDKHLIGDLAYPYAEFNEGMDILDNQRKSTKLSFVCSTSERSLR